MTALSSDFLMNASLNVKIQKTSPWIWEERKKTLEMTSRHGASWVGIKEFNTTSHLILSIDLTKVKLKIDLVDLS